MDKIEKALQRFTPKERESIEEILRALAANDTRNIDVRKLRGYGNIFRVRKGSLRIIYRKDAKEEIFVLAIERRDENTYKHF